MAFPHLAQRYRATLRLPQIPNHAGTICPMEQQNHRDSVHELTIMPAPPSNQGGSLKVLPASAESTREIPRPHNRFKHVTSLIALFSTLLIAALNATIMATAVPTICRELNSAEGYAWIGGAYLLGNAVFGPVWAKSSDIWGRKAILLSAVVCFFCSSIICALSTTMTMLIVGRTFQGISGGGAHQPYLHCHLRSLQHAPALFVHWASRDHMGGSQAVSAPCLAVPLPSTFRGVGHSG